MVAGGDETIDVMRVLSHQIASGGLPGVDHCVQENILAGEFADDGNLELLAEIGSDAEKHGVREGDDLGLDLVPEEIGEAAKLLALRALDSLENADREGAKLGGRGICAELAGETEHCG